MDTPATPASPVSLLDRVQLRCDELRASLADTGHAPRTRADITAALAAIDGLLTGDRANPPAEVRRTLARWLEAHRYLGLKAGVTAVAASAPAPAPAAAPSPAAVSEAAAPAPPAEPIAQVVTDDAAPAAAPSNAPA